MDCLVSANLGAEIRSWGTRVDTLVDEVVDSADGFQVELGPLGDVKTWSNKMVLQMWDHASGVRQMRSLPGHWKALLLEFRKLWEKVWLGYLQDQRSRHWLQVGAQEIDFHVDEQDSMSL